MVFLHSHDESHQTLKKHDAGSPSPADQTVIHSKPPVNGAEGFVTSAQLPGRRWGLERKVTEMAGELRRTRTLRFSGPAPEALQAEKQAQLERRLPADKGQDHQPQPNV